MSRLALPRRVAACLVAVGLLAGCSDGASREPADEASTPAASASASPSPSPTAPAATPDAGTPAPAPSAPPAAAPSAPPAAAPSGPAGALLTVGELPPGYTAAPAPDKGDVPYRGRDECSSALRALDEGVAGAASEAATSFESGLDTLLEQSVRSYPDPAALQEGIDQLARTAVGCGRFTEQGGRGAPMTFTVTALPFPRLGDDSRAVGVTGTTPDSTLSINYVAVRVGSQAVFLSEGGVASDAALLERAARRAVEKLQAAR